MISPLTVKERGEAETFVIRSMQRECFGKLYEHICALNGEICFKVGKSLKAAFRPLKQLNVFCDLGKVCFVLTVVSLTQI